MRRAAVAAAIAALLVPLTMSGSVVGEVNGYVTLSLNDDQLTSGTAVYYEWRILICGEGSSCSYQMFGDHIIRASDGGGTMSGGSWSRDTLSYRAIVTGSSAPGSCFFADNDATVWLVHYDMVAGISPPLLPYTIGERKSWRSGTVCQSVIQPPTPRGGLPVEYVPLEQGLGDPLILDLNGDGIRTTSLDWPVTFDMLGDGVAVTMAWTDPTTEEGFLWVDVIPNNRVDNGRELFGTGTVLPTGERARDGFEALAVYDRPSAGGNGDLRIDRADRIWSRLRLWVDRNHDGASSSDEVKPIHESGLLTIRLPSNALPPPVLDASGNVHMLRTTYAIRDGSAELWRQVHNLVFAVAP